MTAKIYKSAIDAFANFDLEVAEHAARLRHWKEHMAIVESQKGKDIPPIERYQEFDRPRAHELLEAAIDENFNVAYEVVDDSAATLAAKKRQLIARVQEAEGAAIIAIVPAGKQRLLAMRESQIQEEDNERGKLLMEQIEKPGLLKRMLGADGKVDIAASIAEQRPAADTAFLAEMKEVRRRIREIGLIAAQAMHDIEDLTLDNIEQWKLPDFSGV